MNDGGLGISLREYIEQLVETERELRETHERNVSEALTIQAREYERRLEILNGEHGRLAELTRTFMRQETFDTYLHNRREVEEREREAMSIRHLADEKWQREVNRQLDEQRGAATRTTLLLTFGLSAFALLVRFWPA